MDFIAKSYKFMLTEFPITVVIVSLLAISLTLYMVMQSAQNEFREITREVRLLHKTNIPCLQDIYKKVFDEGYRKFNIFVNIPTQLAYACQFVFGIIGTLMSYYVLKSPYPLPTFYVISFYPPTDWLSWTINMIDQNLLCNTAIRYFVFCVTFVQYISGITMANFDATIEIVKNMKKISLELSFEDWVKIVMDLINQNKR